MIICPKCGNQMPNPTTFCTRCGAALPAGAPQGGMPYNPVPPYPAQPSRHPVNPYVPYANQPRPYPASRPSKGLAITGMIFGIGGFALSIFGVIYTLIMMELGGVVTLTSGLVWGFITLPLSLVGLILSSKSRSNGDTSGMSKAGKVLGLIGVILSGLTILIGIIGYATLDSYSYYNYYY